MNIMVRWWRTSGLALKVAVGLVLAAVGVLPFYACAPAWVPSLACNLFTSGLTIYFVNYVLIRREESEAKKREWNLLVIWLNAVIRDTRLLRQHLRDGTDYSEDLPMLMRVASFDTGRFGNALRPWTVEMIDAITNVAAFLDTIEAHKLDKELEGIEGLATTLWNDIRQDPTDEP